jgi:hypothetical protein
MGLIWEEQQSIGSPVATDTGPSLAVLNDHLYAAWKGSGAPAATSASGTRISTAPRGRHNSFSTEPG